jgi:hypothetical protein
MGYKTASQSRIRQQTAKNSEGGGGASSSATASTPGTPGTGGGGGGGTQISGTRYATGAGGSGFVGIAYLSPTALFTGGFVTPGANNPVAPGYTVHKFYTANTLIGL